MGLGAVSGVLGVASTVSGMSQARKQAQLQEAQAQANADAAKANAALRAVQLNTQKNYAEYQAKLNELGRAQQFMESDMALRANAVMDRMEAGQQTTAAQTQQLQSLLQGVQGNAEGDKQIANSKQQALAQGMGADIASAQTQTGLANEMVGQQGELEKGDARRAMMKAILASTGNSGGRTEGVLVGKDAMGDVEQALMAAAKSAGVSELDLQQLMMTKDISEIAKQLGISSGEFQKANAGRADQYANQLYASQSQDIATGLKLSDANRGTARQALQGAAIMDANSDRVNTILSDYGFQQQQNQTQAQLSQQMSAINAQRASISKPGVLDYLSAGFGLYQQAAPLFQGNRQAQPLQNNTPQYGVLNGFNLQTNPGGLATQQGTDNNTFGFNTSLKL